MWFSYLWSEYSAACHSLLCLRIVLFGEKLCRVSLLLKLQVFHDFDAALPDFNELDMQTQIHINQSRIDDITLKEDLIPETTDMPFGAEFGVKSKSIQIFSKIFIFELQIRFFF